MHTIPNTERAKSVIDLDLEKDTLPVERALGVLWNVEKDVFTFGSAMIKKPTTRRGLLSVTSSLYDPMGFVAPVVLTAKKLLQKLCKLGWDEEIPKEVKTEWIQWLTDLQYLPNISISRCFTPSGFRTCKKMELHCFADASEGGYGAAIYLRCTDVSGNIHCSLWVKLVLLH